MSAVADRERALRGELVSVGRRLWERGLLAGRDGNLSVRLDASRLLVTPAGLGKGEMTTEDLVVTDLTGNVMGTGRASSEVQMHVRIYARRPDVAAVVHAHPPMSTAFAVVGETLAPDVLPEVIFQIGDVALVPFAMPGTAALADALDPYLGTHDAFLLANHGATTVGATLRDAHHRMESLEHAARILASARSLGAVQQLDVESVRTLRAAREANRTSRSRAE